MRLRGHRGVLPACARAVILGISERGKGHVVSRLDRTGQHAGSATDQVRVGDQVRVRDLLRLAAATPERGRRAALMARIAEGLDQVADDIAADTDRAEQHAEDIAGLRGQAGMARVVAAFDHRDERREQAC